jgi:hypothetical protein
MKRLVCAASTLAVLALIVGAGGAQSEQPTIKDIMGKLHKGPNSPKAKLDNALKSDSPDWKLVQSLSKQLVTLGALLEKNEPPRGERAAYEKLAKVYAANAKDLDKAAKAEDTAKTRAAFKKISVSCKDCHKAHKGQ